MIYVLLDGKIKFSRRNGDQPGSLAKSPVLLKSSCFQHGKGKEPSVSSLISQPGENAFSFFQDFWVCPGVYSLLFTTVLYQCVQKCSFLVLRMYYLPWYAIT